MKKRIISLSLVLVMILSVIPFGIMTAHAEGTEIITKIEINDFNPEIYGGMTANEAKLQCSYNLPTNAGYCKGNNNTYIINDGKTIYNNEKLVAGKESSVHIEIYAMPFGTYIENPAYDFDGENLENIEVWINGVLRTDVTVEGYNSAWRCVSVYIPLTVEEYVGETHIVSFNSNGGSAVADQEIIDGSYATKPEKPTKEDWVFVAWYSDAELTQRFDFNNTAITDDITLYAKWEEKIIAEKITKIEINDFNPNLIEGMTAYEAKLQCSYSLPDDAGYGKGNNNTYIINGENTIYNDEKLVAGKESFVHIEIYAMPFGVNIDNPTHDFDGENLDAIEVWINGVLRTDVTIEGYNSAWRCVDIYIPIEVAFATYKVSFDANGGSGTMEAVDVAGEYTLPENSFTAPEDKQFKAWSVDGVEKNVGDIIEITKEVTITAIWEDIPTPVLDSIKIEGIVEPEIGKTVEDYFNALLPSITVLPEYKIVDGGIFQGETLIELSETFKAGETYQLALALKVLLAENGTVSVDKGTFKSAINQEDGWLEIRIEFTVSTPEPDPEPTPIGLRGDVNKNGAIDSRDYVTLKRAYFKTAKLDEVATKLADINNNGSLDSRDYVTLKRVYFKTAVIKDDIKYVY